MSDSMPRVHLQTNQQVLYKRDCLEFLQHSTGYFIFLPRRKSKKHKHHQSIISQPVNTIEHPSRNFCQHSLLRHFVPASWCAAVHEAVMCVTHWLLHTCPELTRGCGHTERTKFTCSTSNSCIVGRKCHGELLTVTQVEARLISSWKMVQNSTGNTKGRVSPWTVDKSAKLFSSSFLHKDWNYWTGIRSQQYLAITKDKNWHWYSANRALTS